MNAVPNCSCPYKQENSKCHSQCILFISYLKRSKTINEGGNGPNNNRLRDSLRPNVFTS